MARCFWDGLTGRCRPWWADDRQCTESVLLTRPLEPLQSLREEQTARKAVDARLQQLEIQLRELRHGGRGSKEESDNREHGR